MNPEVRRPSRPGEILVDSFIVPLNMTVSGLAKKADLDVSEVQGVVTGSKRVNAVLAAGLSRALGTSMEFWLNLQQNHDRSL